MFKKNIFKSFPKRNNNYTNFKNNNNWKLQFVEWDLDLDKIDTQDSHNYFRDANLVFKKYSKRSSDLNDAGIINMFYDNVFQYTTIILIIVHGVVYGIL